MSTKRPRDFRTSTVTADIKYRTSKIVYPILILGTEVDLLAIRNMILPIVWGYSPNLLYFVYFCPHNILIYHSNFLAAHSPGYGSLLFRRVGNGVRPFDLSLRLHSGQAEN